MKQIFTLIAVLLSVTTFAAPAPGPKTSKISISNSDRAVTQVKIDGKMYNLNNTFVLDNVRSGKHTVTIYKTETEGMMKKKTTAIYSKSINISSAQLISIDINRTGKVVVKTTTTTVVRDNRNDKNSKNDHDHDVRH